MQFFPQAEYKKKYHGMAYVRCNILCIAKGIQQILMQAEICFYKALQSKQKIYHRKIMLQAL